MNPRIALLRFPGVNCEDETTRALCGAGADVYWVEWTSGLDAPGFDGFVLPGGFSFEDRVRAGAVASRGEWMEALHGASEAGKPILGICNGAQVLVEGGIVPGIRGRDVDLALARNAGAGAGGYLCRWTWVEVLPSACGWLAPMRGSRWPVSVAHGEGRFASADAEVQSEISAGPLCALRYVTPGGSPAAGTEWDPNGSLGAAAGVCNRRGNALALMPHPERSAWLRQVPEATAGEWGMRRRSARSARDLEAAGPGRALLEAFVAAAREGPE